MTRFVRATCKEVNIMAKIYKYTYIKNIQRTFMPLNN